MSTSTTVSANGRTPSARPLSAEEQVPFPGLAALQGSVGNEVVVQMLRLAGRLGEDGRHRHDADCGHPAERQPRVQRSAVHGVLRGSGRPLDEATRTEMEDRLGADFTDVRIHDDAAARASAAEVGARAYTSGSHVVIGHGGADPHTLAHELTHVIQQRRGRVSGTDHGDGLSISDPHDRFEREAEANASRAMSRPAGHPPGRQRGGSVRTAPVGGTGATGPAIQRVPVRVAADSIGSRSAGTQATGERGTFHNQTVGYLYKNSQYTRKEGNYGPNPVAHYTCGVCGKPVEQREADLDHIVSWENLKDKGFSRYQDDPNVYPVNNRRQELLIYNDLENLQIVHAVCNNRKSGDKERAQIVMDIDFLTDRGVYRPDKHLSSQPVVAQATAGGKAKLANAAIGSRSLNSPATGRRASFAPETLMYVYTETPHEMRTGQFSPEPVAHYDCALCGNAVEQLNSEVDHIVSWDSMVSNQFEKYRGDPALHPVNSRGQEVMMYNDVRNLQIVHAWCNNRKSNKMTNTQFKMDVEFLTGTGAHASDRHLP